MNKENPNRKSYENYGQHRKARKTTVRPQSPDSGSREKRLRTEKQWADFEMQESGKNTWDENWG